ncbi:hypothetical protein GCM10023211_18690 [Orbus sasakiae]|uniref:Uncharacterized protein n=1 Tax=Orbus sasakiae TaxID=1078475 RepID=A0ABP9NBE8_9GAMM
MYPCGNFAHFYTIIIPYDNNLTKIAPIFIKKSPIGIGQCALISNVVSQCESLQRDGFDKKRQYG